MARACRARRGVQEGPARLRIEWCVRQARVCDLHELLDHSGL